MRRILLCAIVAMISASFCSTFAQSQAQGSVKTTPNMTLSSQQRVSEKSAKPLTSKHHKKCKKHKHKKKHKHSSAKVKTTPSSLSYSANQNVDDRTKLPNFMYNFYIGAEVAYGSAYYTNSMFQGYTPTSISPSGVAAHPFLGYNFNRYVAAEMDVIYMSRPVINGIPAPSSSWKLHHNIVGFYAVGFYPFHPHWQLFGKLGAGYVARSGITVGSTTVLPEGLFFTPLASVGIAYEFHKQWFVDASANFSFPTGSQLPLSTVYGIGLYYALGGQQSD